MDFPWISHGFPMDFPMEFPFQPRLHGRHGHRHRPLLRLAAVALDGVTWRGARVHEGCGAQLILETFLVTWGFFGGFWTDYDDQCPNFFLGFWTSPKQIPSGNLT